MNSDKKSSELARLRRQHQLVCSVIAALLICAGIYGTVARLGFILMAPLFVIALGVLVDAFLPRVSWFFCVRDVETYLGGENDSGEVEGLWRDHLWGRGAVQNCRCGHK